MRPRHSHRCQTNASRYLFACDCPACESGCWQGFVWLGRSGRKGSRRFVLSPLGLPTPSVQQPPRPAGKS